MNKTAKSSIKGWITAIIIILILAAAALGAAVYYRYVYSKAYVQDVEMLNCNWIISPAIMDGRVSESAAQNVYLNSTDVLETVFVKQGDRVETGDPLFRYDTEVLEAAVEQAALDVDIAAIKLNIEMIRLQNAVDIKPIPSEKEREAIIDRGLAEFDAAIKELDEEYEAKLEEAEQEALAKKNAYIASHALTESEFGEPKLGGADVEKEGDGSEGSPFKYKIRDTSAIISGELINKWIGKQDDGSGTEKNYYYKIELHETVKDEGTGTEEDVTTSVWEINKNTMPVGEGEYYSIKSKTVYYFPEPSEVAPPDYSSVTDPTTGLNFNGYTQEEKDRKISDGQMAVLRAQTALKSDQHKLREAQNKLEHATVRSAMPGTVRTVGDPEYPPKDGSPFIVIAGESGMAVTGYVSELRLDDIKVGDEYTVYSWETGSSSTARVSEISPYPAENYRGWTDGNNNVSWYPFTAYMENDEGFTPGYGVELTPIQQEDTENRIVIEKIYVRSDEKGNYVLREDENGRLERASVTVKSTSESDYYEILTGLLSTDRIAFPYGSKAVVGIRTTDRPPVTLF